MTRDELLLWLNDRCGGRTNVEVTVDLELGGYSRTVAGAAGALQHWTAQPDEAGLLDEAKSLGPRDDLAGMYAVGDCGILDVSELGDVQIEEDLDGAMKIELVPGFITLCVTEVELVELERLGTE